MVRGGGVAQSDLSPPPSPPPQVLRINPRLASVDIVCVGDVPLVQPLSGVIR